MAENLELKKCPAFTANLVYKEGDEFIEKTLNSPLT